MPTSRVSDRIAASLSDLGEARALVAVLCAHLLALSEEREVRLPLSSPERDIVTRAAAVPDEEARRITEEEKREGAVGAARSYLARRFLGTTLAEKYPAAGLGLSDTDASALAHALIYREAILAALEGAPERGAEVVRQRLLPVRLSAPSALLFAYPKMNPERFLTRFADSFAEERDPLRFSLSTDASPEEVYASVLSELGLIADRREGRRAALSAALLRYLSSEFSRAPQGASRALKSAVRDALIAFSEPVPAEILESVSLDVRVCADAVIAVALRERDFIGAARAAVSLSGRPLSREEVRDAAKGLIISEEAKRALLLFIDAPHV